MCLGIPGQVMAILDEDATMAEVEISGVRRAVDVLCVAETGRPLSSLVGAWVLVHVGFAMSRIEEDEARETLRLLAEIGELDGELAIMRASDPDRASPEPTRA
ncbi:hydrogenase maturation factor [Gluconacetobacter johannae DSM 13595]|uniref:Hydrogenase maturation factor HypC n=1 Tax=Gluconacetobacter johannae TaxID=112140 RepID=A0A7W4J8K5_9PROT|nr:HypC/HybG/HupF family hydrogenase formation chaperone [Gluconacetobacter johannae]MBB2176680.1 HypC/HybG/HupF family hydrogenase formation chaperone [Gluconacetobacter johannae]GBQ91321.1 hydrogenase maturation factor [Gluconacetobacter johannae DSM 13595]